MSYEGNPARRTLSLLLTEGTDEQTREHLRDVTTEEFNGRRSDHSPLPGRKLSPWLLPSWFQNLLPEGAFRQHIAELRGCSEHDAFELLAACGADLPGAVYAVPVGRVTEELRRRLVTQDNDAVEASVIDTPLLEGISLSGVQPKLGVNADGQGRYVARTKLEESTHIIAKLPSVEYPLMPEVEELSLRLASLAGVQTCRAWLEPLSRLQARHGYDLGQAVLGRRIYAEDFAQIGPLRSATGDSGRSSSGAPPQGENS